MNKDENAFKKICNENNEKIKGWIEVHIRHLNNGVLDVNWSNPNTGYTIEIAKLVEDDLMIDYLLSSEDK